MALLEVDRIETYYGNIRALKGVSLTVNKGEIVTLIGSNGAGKTTTLRTISGMLHPRRGQVRLEGKRAPSVAPRRIACAICARICRCSGSASDRSSTIDGRKS